jgi:uncharacterized protein (TIGR03083 family)
MASTPAALIALLRRSHDEFAASVAAMSPDEYAGPSYCTEWSIGRVLSHLGSGSQLGQAAIEATRTGTPHLDLDGRRAVWARWDALSDADAAHDYLRYERDFVEYVERLTPAEHEGLRVPFGSAQLTLADFLALRLGEHAVHRWDVEVMASPRAELDDAAVPAILGAISMMSPFLGKGAGDDEVKGLIVAVSLGAHADHTLDLTNGARFSPGLPSTSDATLSAPGPAFVRLCYGRLPGTHTPETVQYEGKGSLDALRRLFPGI